MRVFHPAMFVSSFISTAKPLINAQANFCPLLLSGFGWGVFEKIETPSPKAIHSVFILKLFQTTLFFQSKFHYFLVAAKSRAVKSVVKNPYPQEPPSSGKI